MRAIATLFAAASLTLVAGCEKPVEAPTDRGVCWHAVPLAGGKIKFNKLTTNVPSIEQCAADLESMRLRFLSLGGNQRELMGAYQGNFIFVKLTGIFFSQTLDGHAYPALVRTGDGRLAVPGAMPSP
jgi:hypothetical protein